jgi:hypothetical protein
MIGGDLLRCRQYAERNRQVETSAFLRQIRRRKVNRNAPRREFETSVLQGGTHAIFGLLNFRLGQPDNGKTRQAIGEMRLNRNERRIHAGQGTAIQNGE